jgi:hypothetical protein
MTRMHTAVTGVMVTLTLVAACDGGATSPPTTTANTPSSNSTSQPSASADPATQAPKVQNPLDASSFVLDPCKSLTEAQQQQFGLSNGKIDTAVEGPSCFYKQAGKPAVAVVFASKIKGGLSSRYFEHSRGYWSYWEPTTVDSYPAVGFVATISDPGTLSCHFSIGVTDSLYFWVTADDNPGVARCTASKNVASAVLATIKTGR